MRDKVASRQHKAKPEKKTQKKNFTSRQTEKGKKKCVTLIVANKCGALQHVPGI
jgi:hypothetical protein